MLYRDSYAYKGATCYGANDGSISFTFGGGGIEMNIDGGVTPLLLLLLML
jgi:hypothetical protein